MWESLLVLLTRSQKESGESGYQKYCTKLVSRVLIKKFETAQDDLFCIKLTFTL